MAEFRTKLITLAGIATMFAGMAHAQLNLAPCTAAAGAVFVAAEGTTEQVADTVINCPAQGNAGVATTVNLQVFLSPSVTITSATLGSGGSARSEAMAGITGSFVPGGAVGPAGAAPVVAGVVSGASVTFNNIVIPANAAVQFTITNIKINASQIANSGGAPTAVTETIFIGGTNVTPGVLPAVNVAFATNGLANVKSAQSSGNSIASVPICSGINAFGGTIVGGLGVSSDAAISNVANNLVGNAAFNVLFGEGFATAFKTQGSALTNAALGSEFTNNTYTGYGVTPAAAAPPAGWTAPPAANTATSGTRVQIVFNNIPAGVSAIYVPVTLTATGGVGGFTLNATATGAPSAVTGSTANGAPGATAGNNGGNASAAALTVSNGSATAVYEYTTPGPGVQESYVVPVFLTAGGAAVTAPAGALTATVSFAPVGSSANVPNFVSGSSTATVNGPAFSACSTTLLFPFVTNQLGFDTGLAISNTSTDLLASGGTKSQAAPQSGTCSLTFFGASAPAAVTTATVTTGTVYAAAASTLAPGFQGYMIANCNFLYGHGFAYVVYNLTQNNGAAMGYLADTLTADRKSTISTGNAGGAVGTSGVGSNTPEK